MTTTTVLPLADYPNGTQSFGPVAVADGVTVINLSLTRHTTATPTIWPNASTTLNLSSEISTDGGTTWRSFAGFGSNGGTAFNDDGTESAASSITLSLPAATNRQIRGTVTIAGGPLRSSGIITVS